MSTVKQAEKALNVISSILGNENPISKYEIREVNGDNVVVVYLAGNEKPEEVPMTACGVKVIAESINGKVVLE